MDARTLYSTIDSLAAGSLPTEYFSPKISFLLSVHEIPMMHLASESLLIQTTKYGSEYQAHPAEILDSAFDYI